MLGRTRENERQLDLANLNAGICESFMNRSASAGINAPEEVLSRALADAARRTAHLCTWHFINGNHILSGGGVGISSR